MKKIDLKKGYVFYGYEIYLPDEIIITLSHSIDPIEKNASFGFAWQAEVEGIVVGDKSLAYTESPFLTEKEKTEMFEVIVGQAFRKLDELLAETHRKAGIPQ